MVPGCFEPFFALPQIGLQCVALGSFRAHHFLKRQTFLLDTGYVRPGLLDVAGMAEADGGAERGPLIRTPDQRVRVFISSTLRELATERVAARSAITRLHLTPIMFELGARPHAPRELYRAYLAQSEVFVGIYWQQYGWVAPGEEVSGLEDEYLPSGDRPKLRSRTTGGRRDDLAGHAVDDRRSGRCGSRCAKTGRVRGGHSDRRPNAPTGCPPLRTGGHRGGDDGRSRPGLGLQAETGRCDREGTRFGRIGFPYRRGRDRGRLNQGRTLFSKRVMAQIRWPARVSTTKPVACRIPPGACT